MSGTSNIVILALTAVFGSGGAAALFQWLSRRGKSGAEEAEIWTKASVTRLQTMHEEMTLLDERMRALNAELDEERRRRMAAERAQLTVTQQLERATRLLEAHNIPWEVV